MSHPPAPLSDGNLDSPGKSDQPDEQAPAQGASQPGGSQGRIHWRTLLQRKLLIRITIPTLIGLIQLVFAIIAIFTDGVSALVLFWLVPSIAVGYWFGQRIKIEWDDESAQVSLVGAQALLAISYIVVRVTTRYVLEDLLSGRMWLAVAVLLVSFGLFFGRSLALADQIWHTLRDRREELEQEAQTVSGQ